MYKFITVGLQPGTLEEILARAPAWIAFHEPKHPAFLFEMINAEA